MSFGASGNGFDQFDAVAKRIAELQPLIARDRYSVENLYAGGHEPYSPRGYVRNRIRHMRLGCPPLDPVLGANVHLIATDLEPETSAALQGCRLLHLRESEDSAVKCPRLGNSIGRDRNLHVVDAD